MATIEKRILKNGNTSFRMLIRKKGIEIYKTFSNEEDAILYSKYKERLIQNMENFDIPLNERITLDQLFELKIKTVNDSDRRALCEYNNCLNRFKAIFNKKIFVHLISYEEWLESSKALFDTDIYRGGKTESCKRKMSISSLRRYFATASSVFSYAISQGINLENHPLKVLQTTITPLLKEKG